MAEFARIAVERTRPAEARSRFEPQASLPDAFSTLCPSDQLALNGWTGEGGPRLFRNQAGEYIVVTAEGTHTHRVIDFTTFAPEPTPDNPAPTVADEPDGEPSEPDGEPSEPDGEPFFPTRGTLPSWRGAGTLASGFLAASGADDAVARRGGGDDRRAVCLGADRHRGGATPAHDAGGRRRQCS